MVSTSTCVCISDTAVARIVASSRAVWRLRPAAVRYYLLVYSRPRPYSRVRIPEIQVTVHRTYCRACRDDALGVVQHYLDTVCAGNLHSQVAASTQAHTCQAGRPLACRSLHSARRTQALHAPVPRPHPRRSVIAAHAPPYVRPHLLRVYARAAAAVCRVCVAAAATWSECKRANCGRRILKLKNRFVSVYAIPRSRALHYVVYTCLQLRK